MWQKIKNLFAKEEQPESEAAPPAPKQKKSKKVELSAKEQATQDGKPYVNIIGFEIDPANPTFGSFEIDWNQLFIHQLVLQGFRGQNDEQIIDQWFQSVCRTIALEEYEQFMADPANRVTKKNLGGGRTEFS